MSEPTIAATARLAALAHLANTATIQGEVIRDGEDWRPKLRRLAYSSVLNVESAEQARRVLTEVFIISLRKNPESKVGGILFVDESQFCIVQVLEGPSWAIRSLYYHRIRHDHRHTAVKVLFDIEVRERRYEGFGMKCGSTIEPFAQLMRGVMLGVDSTASPCERALEAALEAESATGQEPTTKGSALAAGDAMCQGLSAQGSATRHEHPCSPLRPPLIRITYTSRLLARGDVAYRLVLEVVREALRNNPRHGIGGCLFFNAATYRVLQVLEGPHAAVLALYEVISRDMRHEQCTLLSAHRTAHRQYEDWGMLQATLADWSALESADWVPPCPSGDDELAIAAHVQLEVRSPRTNLALPHSGDDHSVAAHVGAVATGNDPAYADADPDADPDAGAQICAEPFSTCAAGSGLRSRKHSGTIPLPSFFLRKGRSAGSKEQIAGARAAGRPAPPEAQIVPSQREQQPRPTPELSAASIFVGPDGPVVRWDESSIENSAKRTGKFRLPPKR